MKKYRLIEYNICHQKGVRLEAKYNSLEQVVDALTILLGNNSESYYRIEEVEESITDRVKSYEDACEVKNMAKQTLSLYPKHIAVLIELETITAALNEGWKPDWEDIDQKKWLPTFTTTVIKGSAPTINADIAQWVNFPDGINPSRLYFKSRELAEYAAKQFTELYKQLLLEKF